MGDATTVISPLKVPSSANKNLQYRTYQLILHMREDSVTKGYVKTWVIQHSKQSYKETWCIRNTLKHWRNNKCWKRVQESEWRIVPILLTRRRRGMPARRLHVMWHWAWMRARGSSSNKHVIIMPCHVSHINKILSLPLSHSWTPHH
jgi:hypothetical protein